MRKSALIAGIGATLCLTGCFSLETAVSEVNGQEHVLAGNYGWRLFNCIPLFCGNATEGAKFPWAFFRDDVTMDKIQGRVLACAAEKNREIGDLCYNYYDTIFFNVPLTSIPVPIPYVLCYREIQLSGVMK